jgi:hypothetical protein
VLLAELGRLLQERFLVEATPMHVKPIFSRPAPDDLIDELRAYDAVLTAIGD